MLAVGIRECQGECGCYWPDHVRIKRLSELLVTKGKRKATTIL